MKNLNELKKLIATSYGESDKIFASHAFDVERAQLALAEAFKLGLGFKKYISMHKEYLISKGVIDSHIKEQIKEVKKIERYFTED